MARAFAHMLDTRHTGAIPWAALAVVITAAGIWALWRGGQQSVELTCDQMTVPGADGEFDMRFTLINHGRAVSRIEVDLHDTDLSGGPIGESSSYVLTGPFARGASIERDETVPAPPHFVMAVFSKIDCSVVRIVPERDGR